MRSGYLPNLQNVAPCTWLLTSGVPYLILNTTSRVIVQKKENQAKPSSLQTKRTKQVLVLEDKEIIYGSQGEQFWIW